MNNLTDNIDPFLSKWKNEMNTFVLLAEQTSVKIRNDGVEKSYTILSQFIETCLTLVTSLAAVRQGIEFENKLIEEQWKFLESNLWLVFSDILNAVTKKESIVLADIIEFDLSPIFIEWKNLINI